MKILMLYYFICVSWGKEKRWGHTEVYFCGKLGEEIPDYVHGFAFGFTKNTEKKKKGTEK